MALLATYPDLTLTFGQGSPSLLPFPLTYLSAFPPQFSQPEASPACHEGSPSLLPIPLAPDRLIVSEGSLSTNVVRTNVIRANVASR